MEITLRDGVLYIFAQATDMNTHEDHNALMKIIREIKGRSYQVEVGVLSDFALILTSKNS